jgi:hypothetical protein
MPDQTNAGPGYNEGRKSDHDTSGDVNQAEPSWRPGDEPASTPVNSGMQGEGEPGRAQRDSTGGTEGVPADDDNK